MTEPGSLQRGDQLPHFEVQTVDGRVLSYRSIWQRRNLLLVLLPESRSDAEQMFDLRAREREFERFDTECVITRDGVAGIRAPAVLVADRWGEIIHIAALSEAERSSEHLLGWLEYIQNRCPECEGEAK
jgi:peroxiredoxin